MNLSLSKRIVSACCIKPSSSTTRYMAIAVRGLATRNRGDSSIKIPIQEMRDDENINRVQQKRPKDAAPEAGGGPATVSANKNDDDINDLGEMVTEGDILKRRWKEELREFFTGKQSDDVDREPDDENMPGPEASPLKGPGIHSQGGL